MTIYQLKKLNIANGGVFFDANNMRANNERLKDFSVRRPYKDKNTLLLVTNKKTGTKYHFSATTGRYIP